MDRVGRPPRRQPPGGSRPIPQRRAFSVVRGPVEVDGPPALAHALGELFQVDAALERALTHGFHSYAGRLHPSIARGAVGRWSPPGGTVLDPFCGSGTVLVEAQVAGRRASGLDASPLAVMIARVRSQPHDQAWRDQLVAAARDIAEASALAAHKRRPPAVPRWAAGEFERFHPHVAYELLGLRALVMETPAGTDTATDEALRLCLSSLLVKFMRKGPEAPRDGADKRIARGVPSRFLADRAEELARGLGELALVTPPGTPLPHITLGDAREHPQIPSRSVDLVLTSPPYAGVYDYAEHHAVRFRWLGLPIEALRRRQLGERMPPSAGPGAAPAPWLEARRRWLVEMGRVLRPDGTVVLVTGDGVVGDRPEDAALAVARDAPAAGLTLVARASQARPPRDSRLAALFGRQPRREHILLLRRPPAG
jgi:SAM-dependent methyltransferase